MNKTYVITVRLTDKKKFILEPVSATLDAMKAQATHILNHGLEFEEGEKDDYGKCSLKIYPPKEIYMVEINWED